jgi:UDP-2,4-diacetamido-2,4,6-trideoxy-beta-L-altropyranose hydrolase
MHSVSARPDRGRIAFRCDGDEQIGAGHVARCVPLALAFAQLGWNVGFVGRYEGLAAWLLRRAEIDVRRPTRAAACGIAARSCDAAVIDSYRIAPGAICKLAGRLPLATLAEANRCPAYGILLDYHLDRTASPNARLLAGPSFAPLDPAFAGAGRAGGRVRRVLVMLGGSSRARQLLGEIVPIVGAAFADAAIMVAGGAPPTSRSVNSRRVIALPLPSALVDVVSDVDLAVTAAGITAYEMACAGVPQVALAIVENQRRVISGLRASGLAPCLDLTGEDSLADLPRALEELGDVGLRRKLADRGRRVFDGHGAQRAAVALTERFDAA